MFLPLLPVLMSLPVPVSDVGVEIPLWDCIHTSGILWMEIATGKEEE